MRGNPLLAYPARVVIPTLVALLAVSALASVYVRQVVEFGRAVEQVERLRLTERLNLEQTRLEVQSGLGNRLQVRRLVSGLALHRGVTDAWLIDSDERVLASLRRSDIGRPAQEVLGPDSPILRTVLAPDSWRKVGPTRIESLPDQRALLGLAPIQPAQRLVVRVDLTTPLAHRLAEGRDELVFEASLWLIFIAVVGVVTHLLWFRRAATLTRTATTLASGDLSARARLEGGDELALFGAALDGMAERLQTQHHQLRRLADITDHSPVIAISWANAPGWPATFVSNNIRNWGYDPGEFTSGTLRFSELIHPDDLPEIEADVASHFADGPDSYTQHYRLRKADGKWMHIQDHTWLTRDAEGQVSSIQGMLLDISVREALAEAQRHMLVQLDTVANASPALFWTAGLDKGCDWFNRRWLEFTGRSMEQELGDGWTEGVHPDDYARCLQTYVRAFDARESFSMEYRLRRHDGEYRWLLDRGLPRHDADGRFMGFIGSCLDITEDKLLREALRDSEERLRLALAAANQGLYDLDLQTGEARVSPEYATMLGYDPDTFQETNAAWRARLHPDDASRVEQTFEAYVAGRLPEYRVEFRQRTASGHWKWILSLGRIQAWSADGRPQRLLGTHTDIDIIKAAEAALRESNTSLEARVAERTAELQALNQSLESFVYSVSHDLKAPLRGVDGYSRLLEDDCAERLDEEGRLFVANIRSGVARMGELIDDLLEYSRMERRNLTLDPVNPSELVEQLLAARSDELAENRVTVHSDLPALHVLADPSGLGIALRNLVDNAIKFSKNTAEPRIDIGGRCEGDMALIWVRDNGIGFDMKYHDRIFEIFQRLHRLEDYPGTGIGLALVRKAMQRMGGRAWAESRPGEGATFYLALPLAPAGSAGKG